MRIEEIQIIEAAAGLLKDSESECVFDRRWNAAFGASPRVCCILWDMLEPDNDATGCSTKAFVMEPTIHDYL